MRDFEVIFRKADAGDAQEVASVYLRSHGEFLAFAPLAHSEAEVREWMAKVLVPGGRVTVAETDGNIVGMIAVSEEDGMGWINQLYLHPAFVGKGIGSVLVDRAKSDLGGVIRLYAFQENLGGRRFYERHGFRAIAFSDGMANEQECPDVLYEFSSRESDCDG